MMKKENEITLSHDDEMAALLPYYVTGGLDDKDMGQVARWIESSERGRDALQNALDEQAEVISANEAIAPPANALNRLMDEIEKMPQPKRIAVFRQSFWRRQLDWFNATPPVLAWGTVAALLLVAVIQTSMILQPRGNEPFVVAAGSEDQLTGKIALVRFTSDATMAQISEALADVDASVISGPRGQDTFLVRFPESDALAPASERMKKLKARSSLIRLLVEKKTGN